MRGPPMGYNQEIEPRLLDKLVFAVEDRSAAPRVALGSSSGRSALTAGSPLTTLLPASPPTGQRTAVAATPARPREVELARLSFNGLRRGVSEWRRSGLARMRGSPMLSALDSPWIADDTVGIVRPQHTSIRSVGHPSVGSRQQSLSEFTDEVLQWNQSPKIWW